MFTQMWIESFFGFCSHWQSLVWGLELFWSLMYVLSIWPLFLLQHLQIMKMQKVRVSSALLSMEYVLQLHTSITCCKTPTTRQTLYRLKFPTMRGRSSCTVHSCFTQCKCPIPRAWPLHKNGQDVSQCYPNVKSLRSLGYRLGGLRWTL